MGLSSLREKHNMGCITCLLLTAEEAGLPTPRCFLFYHDPQVSSQSESSCLHHKIRSLVSNSLATRQVRIFLGGRSDTTYLIWCDIHWNKVGLNFLT